MPSARLYKQRHEAGKCVDCGVPALDSVRCDGCRDRVNRRRQGTGREPTHVVVSSFRECCQAFGRHRFDCTSGDPNRAAGPLLPRVV